MKSLYYFVLLFLSFVQALAQQNLSFEEIDDSTLTKPTYWYVGGKGYDFVVDSTTAHQGTRSLRMHCLQSGTFGIARQTISADSFVGADLTLSGWIETHDVSEGYAGLWLRLDGVYHEIYLDNMGGRGITGTTSWTRYEIKASVSSDVRQIAYGALLTGKGTAWFDSFELNSLFHEDPSSPSAEAVSYINQAVDIMQHNSIKRDSIDWKSLRMSIVVRSRGAMQSKDTYPHIRYALDLLGDHHSFFMAPEQVQSWEHGEDRSGTNAFVRSEIIQTRFAYISIPAFTSGIDSAIRDFATQIQCLIAVLDSANPCGWIVDLRNDGGGNMWPMLAGLGPIIGEGELGEFVYPQGTHATWWYKAGELGIDSTVLCSVMIPPYRLHTQHPFVAVLTGGATASSGEAVATSFRGRPNTRSFGSATLGLSTSNVPFRLSDGAMIVLTTSTFADRAGNLYGNVIEPDEIIQAGPSTDLSGDPVVQAALSWLKMRSSCKNN